MATQIHCVKSVRIRSYSGPYSVKMRENTDQNNSEYGHFSRSGCSQGKVNIAAVTSDFLFTFIKELLVGRFHV